MQINFVTSLQSSNAYLRRLIVELIYSVVGVILGGLIIYLAIPHPQYLWIVVGGVGGAIAVRGIQIQTTQQT